MFLDVFAFSKSIFGRFAFLSQTAAAIEIRSGKAICFVNFHLFSQEKACIPAILCSGNPPSPYKTTPGRKGTGQREPWATALTGKKADVHETIVKPLPKSKK